MAQEVTNFARFYAIVQQTCLIRAIGEEFKKQIDAAVHVEPDGQSEGNDGQGV
mgnify:CR=1 FL=1